MPLPTFLIVGAQKCGTSSLAAMLRRHPQVHMAKPKELHFFDREHERGLEWYAEQFSPKPAHVAVGEATPVYLYDDEARQRITTDLPDAKLVIILRDPVKRAYSHYWHSRRMGFEDVETFEEALALEPERLASSDRGDRIRFSYTDRGHYLRQITALQEAHGTSLVHVMLLDDLREDHRTALAELCTFLGVDPEPAQSIDARWTNRYRVQTSPEAKQTVVPYPPIDPVTQARLAEHFAPLNEALGAHLGRDLGAWGDPVRS